MARSKCCAASRSRSRTATSPRSSGPSGGGKSTFLRCLNGLERFDGGRVEIAAPRSCRAWSATRTRLPRAPCRVGMVFQQFHLFPHLRARERRRGADPRRAPCPKRRASALALLARVGLASKAHARPACSPAASSSARCDRALAMEPQVILFDEPDELARPAHDRRGAGRDERPAADGLTMVVVTHAMAFARQAAKHVHVFHEGRVVESGRPSRCSRTARGRRREFLRLASR